MKGVPTDSFYDSHSDSHNDLEDTEDFKYKHNDNKSGRSLNMSFDDENEPTYRSPGLE